MIDKKPFRVTNEQAKRERDCYKYSYCEECPNKPENPDTCESGQISASDHATDLLDAREIIDKQEAIIKEMREGLEYIYCLNVNPTTTELSNITRLRLASNRSKQLLEKLKDYA